MLIRILGLRFARFSPGVPSDKCCFVRSYRLNHFARFQVPRIDGKIFTAARRNFTVELFVLNMERRTRRRAQ
jgi:hypothetical protein